MWVQFVLGLLAYKLYRYLCDDDVPNVGNSDGDGIFAVSERIEKLYGGKVYVGLRIPDAETVQKQDIDIVSVTKEEAVVITVKNIPGLMTINANGTWVLTDAHSLKSNPYPDPVAENRQKLDVLGEYLERRGITLPDGYLFGKVVFPNPKFCAVNPKDFPPEFITHEHWDGLKPRKHSSFFGRLSHNHGFSKNEIDAKVHHDFTFALATSPMYDRLEVKGNRHVLGEFIGFKGKQDDLLALSNVERQEVSKIVVQKFSMFGLAPRTVHVLYSYRDYSSEGTSSSGWRPTTVSSATEVVFQSRNDKKPKSFALSTVASLCLSV